MPQIWKQWQQKGTGWSWCSALQIIAWRRHMQCMMQQGQQQQEQQQRPVQHPLAASRVQQRVAMVVTSVKQGQLLNQAQWAREAGPLVQGPLHICQPAIVDLNQAG